MFSSTMQYFFISIQVISSNRNIKINYNTILKNSCSHGKFKFIVVHFHCIFVVRKLIFKVFLNNSI